MPDPKQGDAFGDWELAQFEGKGGNAWVWRARSRQTGEERAIKLLITRKVDREPFKRFRREIEILLELGERPGILPILDHHLPTELAAGERTWLVMPVATRLDEALKAAELATIVTAFADVSATLADLHEERGLAHRDIKPQNLYRWNDAFVVGDFGLVELPDAEALTEPGTVTGPANYLPREALQDPDNADWQRVDVFSLAKSLSVVATDQNWPPPGHQPVGGAWSIGNFRPHPRAQLLDQLIERGSRDEPQTRPSMREVAQDLRAWLELPEASVASTELAELAAQVREQLASQIDTQDREQLWRDTALRLYEELEEQLQPIAAALSALPNFAYSSADADIARQLEHYAGTGPQELLQYAAGMRATEPASPLPLALRTGVSLTALDNGDLEVRALMELGREGESLDALWQSEERRVPIESVEASGTIQQTVTELGEQAPRFVRLFAQRLAQS